MATMIDREALGASFRSGTPEEVISAAARMGYRRGRFSNGLEVIATADGSDWIHPPTYTMRQAARFHRAWAKLPLIQMP